MFVTAEVTVEQAKVDVAVPRTALHSVDSQPVVFIEAGDGFRLRAVTPGKRDKHSVEIQAGLAPGERVVTHGGFTLKSELLRSEFAGGDTD